jgi:hypothetical protein
MTDATYSFVYDRITADAAFHGIPTRELLLSLLAAMPPEAAWDGCLVYEGASPLEGHSVCIGMTGSGSDQLQLKLVEALERQGVGIRAVYEGGPEVRTPIARASGELWVSPEA